MKTLNDYIKESLLDDEEDLISGAEKISKNWLLTLKRAMLNDASEEELKRIINQDMVKKEVSKLFYKFDGRMTWSVGKYSGVSGKFASCILTDTKERSKYISKPVISFIRWYDLNKNTINIEIQNIDNLTETARKNVKPTELEKFKRRVLELGAEYSKTGSGKIQDDMLKI